jgi:transposase-like protein
MRNLLATVPQGAREPIAAIVRTIFAQPDHATAMTQLRKVADGLRMRFASTAAVLEEAAEDVLAYRLFPSDHQRQLHSTNVLERRHSAKQDEEWSIAERRYCSAESMKQLSPPALPPSAQELLAAMA